ncbi:MAG: hypothetical protein ACO1QB_15840 [Verrucomicrobiales bacterium]
MTHGKLLHVCTLAGAILASTAPALASPAPDTDGDGLSDTWEMALVNARNNDAIQSIQDVLPHHDFDLDGRSNLLEFTELTSAVNYDFCYPESALQAEQRRSEQNRFDAIIGQSKYEGSWVRQWTWKNFDVETALENVENRPSGFHAHPDFETHGSMHRYVDVPATGVTFLTMDLNTFWYGDAFLAVKVNSQKIWESTVTGDWKTLRIDLRPWAGKKIQLEILHQVGGPGGIWYFENIQMDKVDVVTLETAPAGLIAPTTFPPDSRNCRWFEGWVFRNDSMADQNQNIHKMFRYADGKEYVLATHPTSIETPATFERTVQLPAKDPYLKLVVRSAEDCVIKVFVGQTERLSRVVDGKEWDVINLPLTEYAGTTQKLRIEHWAGGERNDAFETAYWADILITQIPQISIRTTSVEICWDSIPGGEYQLEWKETVGTQAWTPLGEKVVGNGDRICRDVAVPRGTPSRIYRLVPLGN